MTLLQSLDDEIKGMPRMQQYQSPEISATDFSGLLQSVQCVDAKLLQLCKVSEELLHSKLILSHIEAVIQESMSAIEQHGAVLQTWGREVPPKIKEAYGFTALLPALNKAVQANALDTAKQLVLLTGNSFGRTSAPGKRELALSTK